MAHWNTKKMVELFSSLDCSVVEGPSGGDVDSENIQLTAKWAADGNFLDVRGFVTRGVISTPDDCEVEMVEVSDGHDSRGGLNTDDEPTCLLYAKVCSMLRKKGFSVVPSLDAYF